MRYVTGIYTGEVPGLGQFAVANHIRACLDLLSWGDFGTPGGMREHFLADDGYAPVVFAQVKKLAGSAGWDRVDAFMEQEYRLLWTKYRREEMLSGRTRDVSRSGETGLFELVQMLTKEDSPFYLMGTAALHFCYGFRLVPAHIELAVKESTAMEATMKAMNHALNGWGRCVFPEGNRFRQSVRVEREDAVSFPVLITRRRLGEEEHTERNHIRTCSLDAICRMLLPTCDKRFVELFDTLCLCADHFDRLSVGTRSSLQGVFSYLDSEQVSFLVATQGRELTTFEELTAVLGKAYRNLGLCLFPEDLDEIRGAWRS